MSYHRFQVGQTVAAAASGAPPGPYRITRLLPSSDAGIPNYRGKSLVDGHERALSELSIRVWQAPADTSAAEPAVFSQENGRRSASASTGVPVPPTIRLRGASRRSGGPS